MTFAERYPHVVIALIALTLIAGARTDCPERVELIMKRRGPKPRVIFIARELNVSVATVERDFKKAVKKLKIQNAFGGLLECVHAVALQERDVLQPYSIECQVARGDYIP